MNLLIFLTLVFFYLFVIDVRLAIIQLCLSGDRKMRAIHRQAILGSRWILFWGERLIGLRVRMDEAAAVLPDQFVMLANHQSLLDILVVLAGFPNHGVRFVAKQELGRFVPGASRVLRYGRHALIHRYQNLRETSHTLRRFAASCRYWKFSPVIFPEGTRSTDGNLKTFHMGAYRFVQEPLMLPTAVVAIDGGSNFSHFQDFLRKNDYFYRIRLISVLPAPGDKQEIKDQLAQSRELITHQLEAWKAQELSC